MRNMNVILIMCKLTLVFFILLIFFLIQTKQTNLFIILVKNKLSQNLEFKGTVSKKGNISHANAESNKLLNDFVIFNQSEFNEHPIGEYTDEMFKSDWNSNRALYQPNTTKIMFVDGKKVLANFYPKGTWGRGGGLNQLVSFTSPNTALEEIYLTYRIKFQKGFDWGIVGKLPGFLLGSVNTVASAGDGPNIGDKGASLRLVWLENGKLSLYVYHHQMKDKYGDDMGIGSFGQLIPDKWHEITIRVVTNEVGKTNGIMQVWLDRNLVATSDKIELRTETSPQYIQEIAISTFMGGADVRFAPKIDQFMFIDDIYLWHYSEFYLEKNPLVSRTQKVHPKSFNLYNPLDIE